MDGDTLSNPSFFKPTHYYKEFVILDLIEKNSKVTQREMSNTLDIAVSMVNSYLDDYEDMGYIERVYHSTKSVEYFVTKKGQERRKVLNIGYLRSTQDLYNQAKSNIETFLIQLNDKGFKNILLYGAGEVCEIMLQTITSSKVIKLNAVGIIDDDEKKIGKKLYNTPIISRKRIGSISHDGILISSFTNRKEIKANLSEMNYDISKLIEFFE